MARTKGQSARERMKKHREKVKSDPLLYEEIKRKERERYRQRVAEGKIKNASSKMTDREKRKLRKQWREKTKRYRAAKKLSDENQLEEDTPPPSPPAGPAAPADIVQQNEIMDKRKESGRKIRRKHREKLKSRIKDLESQLKNMERKLSKYKKRQSRKNAETKKTMEKTPRKLVKQMLQNQKVSPAIKKRLLFCSVVEKQITESFNQETSANKKRDFANKMAGAIVKKYRFLESIKTLTSKRIRNPMKSKQITTGAQEKRIKLQQAVKDFFLLDENSRSTAGKKETITRRGLKTQKRFMNESMKGLYAKFVERFPGLKISYSMFCLYRPFWVLRASEKDRNTCLCKMHENFEILIRKLWSRNIISCSSPEKVVEAMTCKNRGQNCLERTCASCKKNKIEFSGLDLFDKTILNKWVTEKQLITIKGKEKTVQKTVKTEIECTNQDLFQEFNDNVYKYFQHIANIKHQYKTLDEIKGKLKEQDLLIHMDFSENYSCKYASEVQSSHFGASKIQISLHTVVVYYYSKESKTVENKCFATVTENLRHDPAAIFAHMQPVVNEMKMHVGDVKTVHILTDGPTTQYRNRTLFYLLGNYAPLMFGDSCAEINWHYSEAGHGKGAPDGIGGCLKRTADRLVAEGKDITSSQAMLEILTREIRNVKLLQIDEAFISHIDQFLPDPKTIRAFKGTVVTCLASYFNFSM